MLLMRAVACATHLLFSPAGLLGKEISTAVIPNSSEGLAVIFLMIFTAVWRGCRSGLVYLETPRPVPTWL